MKIDDLLLSEKTHQHLEQLKSRGSHTIALAGAKGIGKKTVALGIAAELLDTPSDKLAAHPYVRIYSPVKNAISIESAREIIGFIALKTTGRGTIRRVIIIEDAHTLTIEAQNALLKSLEEPPKDTVFILTITSVSEMLPTIISRTRVINIVVPAKEVTAQYFIDKNYSRNDVAQYYFMSGGLPGLMSALLEESDEHSFVHAIKQAKEVLQSDTFQRLAMIDSIAKDKQSKSLVEALKRMSGAMLLAEATKDAPNDQIFKKWTTILSASETASQRFSKNGQEKLILTDLFLSM